MASVRLLGAAVIGHFDALTARNVVPYLPAELHGVPRANIQFLPILDAWFSGSMNYLGQRAPPAANRSTKRVTRSTPRSKSRCPSFCSW